MIEGDGSFPAPAQGGRGDGECRRVPCFPAAGECDDRVVVIVGSGPGRAQIYLDGALIGPIADEGRINGTGTVELGDGLQAVPFGMQVAGLIGEGERAAGDGTAIECGDFQAGGGSGRLIDRD